MMTNNCPLAGRFLFAACIFLTGYEAAAAQGGPPNFGMDGADRAMAYRIAFGTGLRVSATAPDGVIEAIEDPTARFCLGVQWHPENFFRTGEFRALFEGFLEASASPGK